MSGFSNAINATIDGVVSYNKAYDQAMKEKELKKKQDAEYDLLMQKKQQELQSGNQEIDMNDQALKIADYKLNILKDNALKTKVDITKRDFSKPFFNFIGALSKHQGNLAKIQEDGTKTYTVPDEINEDVKDMKRQVVFNPAGADWINHFLDSQYGTLQNPIVDVHFDAPSDQLVFTQRNGRQINMSPQLAYGALGMDKYSTWRQQKELETYSLKSKALYEKSKAITEAKKGNAAEQNAQANLFKAETERLKLEQEAKKVKNSKDGLEASLAKIHETSYKALNNPTVTSKDIKPMVDTLMSNKAFTDDLTKNKDVPYNKVLSLKKFSEASKDLLKEVENNPDLLKTGTIQSLDKTWIKLTGSALPGSKKEEYLKAQDYQTRAKLFIMDYLQYKSGAAFGAEELKGYKEAGGILDFTSPDMALSSLKGMTQYLRNKTIRDIENIPNANQKLVLSYKMGLISPENSAVKLQSLYSQDRNKAVEYLRELKTKYPVTYYALKQTFKGQ